MDATKNVDEVMSYMLSLPDLSSRAGHVVGHWIGYWLSALFTFGSVYVYEF